MATPWWLKTQYNFDPEQGSSQSYYDARTGKPVYQQGGQWYSELPKAESYEFYGDDTAGGYRPIAATSGVLADNSPSKSVQFIAGQKAPYGNLGGEYGLVDGRPSYLFPMDRGASIAGDIGTYGGSQRATWRSPSGAQGQVVQGPDGSLWVAAPSDAMFGESDAADHSTMIGNAIKDFGPIVGAALPFTGIGNALTGALGQVGGRAASGALQSLISGGNPLMGAAMGGLRAAAPGLNNLANDVQPATGGLMDEWTSGYDLPMGGDTGASDWTSGYDLPMGTSAAS